MYKMLTPKTVFQKYSTIYLLFIPRPVFATACSVFLYLYRFKTFSGHFEIIPRFVRNSLWIPGKKTISPNSQNFRYHSTFYTLSFYRHEHPNQFKITFEE